MGHQDQVEASSQFDQSQRNGGTMRHYVSSKWEFLAATLGLILVLGSIGFMVYEGIWGDSSPPSVRIQVESIDGIESGFLVKFRATNSGGSTAEALTVEGEVSDGKQTLEASTLTLDFLPSHSVRRGGLFFTRDPRQFQLKLRPLGYKEP